MEEVAWSLLFKAARFADAAMHGYAQARQRYEETQQETQERHAREDAEWRTNRPTTTDGRKP